MDFKNSHFGLCDFYSRVFWLPNEGDDFKKQQNFPVRYNETRQL